MGTGSPGAGITVGCEMSNVGAGDQEEQQVL